MGHIKHLLPAVPKYFKTNLHTHTTISDGKLSPEEVKELYKSKGYQVRNMGGGWMIYSMDLE